MITGAVLRLCLDRIQPRFRRQRMAHFMELFPDPGSIIDLGGTPSIWSYMADPPKVTLVNIKVDPDSSFPAVEADATRVPFADMSFDLVFSNSCLEHLVDGQREAFARECLRLAPHLWVQTPARCFPAEPHFIGPPLWVVPKRLRAWMLRYLSVRGRLTRPSQQKIERRLRDTQLVTYRELRALFPGCRILRERVLLLTKSYIVMR